MTENNKTANGSLISSAKTRPVNESVPIKTWIKRYEKDIAKALPSVITPERFMRICTTAVSMNPKLALCTPESFIGAMLSAAQLGLEPNSPLGQAYLIPYSNRKKGCTECQFQIGYKGLIDLAYRSGDVTAIEARTVYENDLFEFEYGIDSYIRHKPALTDKGKPIAYYATFKNKDGFSSFTVMSKEDVIAFKNAKSMSAGSGPWVSDFDAMAKKTVLKQLLKYAPLKSEFSRSVASDSSVKNWDADSDGDMSLIQPEYEDVEFSETDPEKADETAD